MKYTSILPAEVVSAIENATTTIAKINIDLWDEATHYLIENLKEKATEKRNHFIFGAKYLADLKEHISTSERNTAYSVVRN